MGKRAFHPILLALYPVLFIYAHNIRQTPLTEVVVPAAISVVFAAALWLLARLLFGDSPKAAIAVSAFVLLLFSYSHFGRLLDLLITGKLGGLRGAGDVPLVLWVCLYAVFVKHYFALWLVVLGACLFFVARARGRLEGLNGFLNVVALALVGISAFSIGSYFAKTRLAWHGGTGGQVELPEAVAPSSELPDIYYIILDGYARADVLKRFFGYDNSEFLDRLKSRGFFIASESHSNYSQTCLSLASSLNYSYINFLADRLGTDSDDLAPLYDLLWNNAVARFLRRSGYRFVAFSSGWYCTDMKNADIYLAPKVSLTEFHNTLIATTPIALLMERLPTRSQFDIHRDRLMFIFDGLANMPDHDFPVFVFAHIIAPHPPFVFGANGEPVEWPKGNFFCGDGNMLVDTEEERAEYKKGYVAQLTYINAMVEKTVDAILARSRRPVVIVLQGDHGSGLFLNWESVEKTNIYERMSILNAYRLPGGNEGLYDSITPVNTFRVIFNRYLGTNMQLLDDRSYFSTWSRPYRFLDVSDELSGRSTGEGLKHP